MIIIATITRMTHSTYIDGYFKGNSPTIQLGHLWLLASLGHCVLKYFMYTFGVPKEWDTSWQGEAIHFYYTSLTVHQYTLNTHGLLFNCEPQSTQWNATFHCILTDRLQMQKVQLLRSPINSRVFWGMLLPCSQFPCSRNVVCNISTYWAMWATLTLANIGGPESIWPRRAYKQKVVLHGTTFLIGFL